jgi:hypothetical protein
MTAAGDGDGSYDGVSTGVRCRLAGDSFLTRRASGATVARARLDSSRGWRCEWSAAFAQRPAGRAFEARNQTIENLVRVAFGFEDGDPGSGTVET